MHQILNTLNNQLIPVGLISIGILLNLLIQRYAYLIKKLDKFKPVPRILTSLVIIKIISTLGDYMPTKHTFVLLVLFVMAIYTVYEFVEASRLDQGSVTIADLKFYLQIYMLPAILIMNAGMILEYIFKGLSIFINIIL